jgi:hypothetical protein
MASSSALSSGRAKDAAAAAASSALRRPDARTAGRISALNCAGVHSGWHCCASTSRPKAHSSTAAVGDVASRSAPSGSASTASACEDSTCSPGPR